MDELNAHVKANDKRLRRKTLFVLALMCPNSPTKFVTARTLKDQIDGCMSRGSEFRDDGHALAIFREMAALGMIAEQKNGFRKRGERFGLDNVEFTILEKGILQHQELNDPHPLIDDERIVE